jgi:hypothetical protein
MSELMFRRTLTRLPLNCSAHYDTEDPAPLAAGAEACTMQ